jgi:hypothetical protein
VIVNFNAGRVGICNNILLSCKLVLNQSNGAKLLPSLKKN